MGAENYKLMVMDCNTSIIKWEGSNTILIKSTSIVIDNQILFQSITVIKWIIIIINERNSYTNGEICSVWIILINIDCITMTYDDNIIKKKHLNEW